MGARGCATSVMRVDAEGLVLGVIVIMLRLGIGFRQRNGATRADTTGCDTSRAVAEHVALTKNISALVIETENNRLTAITLKKPMTTARIPDATRSLQKGKVKDFWLVASLFMLPNMLSPRTIIAQPRVTKP